jgi:hypothetical protein
MGLASLGLAIGIFCDFLYSVFKRVFGAIFLRVRPVPAAGSARRTSATTSSRTSGRACPAAGSVALSLCTTAYPLYTRFANIFGASISETTMRPSPSSAGGTAILAEDGSNGSNSSKVTV